MISPLSKAILTAIHKHAAYSLIHIHAYAGIFDVCVYSCVLPTKKNFFCSICLYMNCSLLSCRSVIIHYFDESHSKCSLVRSSFVVWKLFFCMSLISLCYFVLLSTTIDNICCSFAKSFFKTRFVWKNSNMNSMINKQVQNKLFFDMHFAWEKTDWHWKVNIGTILSIYYI